MEAAFVTCPPKWPTGTEVNAMQLRIAYMRHQRDELLHVAIRAMNRHTNQKTFGLVTTLTDGQILEVAQYAQLLRDVPQQPGFSVCEVHWPNVPECLKTAIIA